MEEEDDFSNKRIPIPPWLVAKAHETVGEGRSFVNREEFMYAWLASLVESIDKSHVPIEINEDDPNVDVTVIDPDGNSMKLEDIPEEMREEVLEHLRAQSNTGADTIWPMLLREGWGDQVAMLN